MSASRLRDSIAELPTWPGLALAALVLAGVGYWNFGHAYQRCSELKGARENLRSAIEAADRTGAPLDLAAAVPGAWDEVRIADGHKLAQGQRPLHCPLGWDLTGEERSALIASGDYTLIGFFERGEFRRYIEYRGDWARFEGDVEALPRSEARFEVARPESGPVILTPIAR